MDYGNFLRKILTQAEVDELAFYNERPALKSALKKVLLAQIYHQGVLEKGIEPDSKVNFMMADAHNETLTEEELGKNVRQKAYACRLIETALDELERFEKVKLEDVINKNPAR